MHARYKNSTDAINSVFYQVGDNTALNMNLAGLKLVKEKLGRNLQ